MNARKRIPRLEKQRRRRAICLCAGVTVVLLELVLRALFPIPEMPEFNRSAYGNFSGSGPRGCEWVETASEPDHAAGRMYLNRYGFRTPEFNRNATRPRTLFIGDSFTEGFMVNEGESFVDRIRAGRANEEIINLGISGANIPNYSRLIHDAVPLLRPSRVILVLHTNDFYVAHTGEFELSSSPPDALNAWLPCAYELIRRAFAGSPVHSWLMPARTDYFAAVPSPLNPLTGHPVNPGVDAAIIDAAQRGLFNPSPLLHSFTAKQTLTLSRDEAENVVRVIEEFAAAVRGAGAQFELAYVPINYSVSARYNEFQKALGMAEWKTDGTRYTDINRAFELIADRVKTPAVDLTGVLLRAADSAATPCYFGYDGHLTAHGHQVAAEALAAKLFAGTAATQAARSAK